MGYFHINLLYYLSLISPARHFREHPQKNLMLSRFWLFSLYVIGKRGVSSVNLLKRENLRQKPFLKCWSWTKFMTPFYGWGSNASRRLEPLRGGSLLFTLSSQKFLALSFFTLEGWKAELKLEPPRDFEHRNPGLGIQSLNP